MKGLRSLIFTDKNQDILNEIVREINAKIFFIDTFFLNLLELKINSNFKFQLPISVL